MWSFQIILSKKENLKYPAQLKVRQMIYIYEEEQKPNIM